MFIKKKKYLEMVALIEAVKERKSVTIVKPFGDKKFDELIIELEKRVEIGKDNERFWLNAYYKNGEEDWYRNKYFAMVGRKQEAEHILIMVDEKRGDK